MHASLGLIEHMGDYDYLFKLIIFGDSPVGKSNLLLQLTEQHFRTAHDLTIGVEFGTRTLTVGNKRVKLQIWDTAGQESFRAITRSYYRGAVAALLVFDVTKRETFEHLGNWLGEVSNYQNLMVVLVGNKADLEFERQVSQAEAELFAEARSLPYIETSAKTGINVEKCFTDIISRILTNIEANVYDLGSQEIGIKVGARQATG